ncbi:hypothetical protein [Metasolibacillus sp.]|uniref:hypothetical protein n=1 Tax=Metasolibacillus sp. TaxID=2703680 RepID=UPI0025F44D77|nr:hypothetical protein [Metasolibacillus sp.]MCT6923918.1 hypothetical protein [Metasolibacillus sp.]MCT6940456.1 hypothetical protein [Metasolibacillus sp.]
MEKLKGLTLYDTYTQKENNVTKALIDLLRFSDVQLTFQFIKHCLGISEILLEEPIERRYALQVGNKLNERSGYGYVIGISDRIKNDNKNSNVEKDTVPDALIKLNNITLLIESKVDGNKIDMQQIKDHEKMFDDGVIIQPYKEISWEDIYEFFLKLDRSFIENDSVTELLLDQYIVYCENMGFSSIKSKGYIYTYFANKPKVLSIIKEIDNYLTNLDYVYFNEKITDCFGYKIKKRNGKFTNKFFTSSTYKKGAYILHFSSYELASEIQMELDRVFQGNKKMNNTKSEAQIYMDLVDSFQQLKPYLDIAYRERLNER